MYRLRHLSQEVPLRRHQHHQPAHQPRDAGHPPLQREQLQAASPADAEAGAGIGASGYERDREEYGVEDTGGEAEAEFGAV